MKSKNTVTDIVIANDDDMANAVEKMEKGDIDTIISCVYSDIPILVLNAIIFGGQHRIKDASFIRRLKEDLIFSDITFFGKKLSDFVEVTLDLLDVQKYKGNDDYIKELINTFR